MTTNKARKRTIPIGMSATRGGADDFGGSVSGFIDCYDAAGPFAAGS